MQGERRDCPSAGGNVTAPGRPVFAGIGIVFAGISILVAGSGA